MHGKLKGMKEEKRENESLKHEIVTIEREKLKGPRHKDRKNERKIECNKKKELKKEGKNKRAK